MPKGFIDEPPGRRRVCVVCKRRHVSWENSENWQPYASYAQACAKSARFLWWRTMVQGIYPSNAELAELKLGGALNNETRPHVAMSGVGE